MPGVHTEEEEFWENLVWLILGKKDSCSVSFLLLYKSAYYEDESCQKG